MELTKQILKCNEIYFTRNTSITVVLAEKVYSLGGVPMIHIEPTRVKRSIPAMEETFVSLRCCAVSRVHFICLGQGEILMQLN